MNEIIRSGSKITTFLSLEDLEALGSAYQGRKCGTFGTNVYFKF